MFKKISNSKERVRFCFIVACQAIKVTDYDNDHIGYFMRL
jgi:hypothetical protein